MNGPGVTVLLIGSTARNTSPLEYHLRKRGCNLWFASSKKQAIELLQSRRFDLLLSEFILPDGTAYGLMAQLLGTDTTMFVSNAVEDSCWWMTAVLRGQDRSQEAGMRPREFTTLLDKFLDQKLAQNQVQGADRSLCTGEDENDFRNDSTMKHIVTHFRFWESKIWRSIMRRTSNPRPYFLIPVKASAERGFRCWNQVLISLATLVLGILLLAIVPQAGSTSSAASKVPLKIDKDPASVSLADFKNGYAPVIDPALPAVVNISSTKMIKQQNNVPRFMFDDPIFRQFFGRDQFDQQPAKPETEREYSLGSGVIVNPDGYILTNNHVVAGASDIEVFTQDRKKFRAKLIGTDPQSDVAVVKIDAKQLPFLTLGDSARLKVGDVVFAIGDPFGVGETATMGIVSATGRTLGGAIEHYENFIQTDASINPGNSGGALLDLHGDLIGINTAIISGGGGGNQGVGFAIPIDMARNVMEQIVDHGKVVRGHLGISIQNVDADMAKAFGLSQGGGALVADVTPGSPAAKAGIERGDIILELNGQPVSAPDDLSLHISQIAPRTTVHLKISRNGQTRDVSVTLDELSEKIEASATGEAGSSALKGVQVQNLTPAIASDLGISARTTGVVITSVDPSSPAAAADLESGDLIQEVNHKPVRNVAEYDRAIGEIHEQQVLLLVKRGATTRFVVVEPQ